MFVIKQIGLPLRGRPILLITRMITGRIGLHSVLFPLLTGAQRQEARGFTSVQLIISSLQNELRKLALHAT